MWPAGIGEVSGGAFDHVDTSFSSSQLMFPSQSEKAYDPMYTLPDNMSVVKLKCVRGEIEVRKTCGCSQLHGRFKQ